MSTFIEPSANANTISNRKAGRIIFNQAFNALKKDTRVLLVPLIAMLVNIVFFVGFIISWILLIPAMNIYNATNTVDFVLGAVLYLAFACTQVFSQAILMSAANDIFEGKPADLSAAVRKAFSRFGSLFLFAVLEATVGLILRAIAERLQGIGGALLRFIGGLAWSIASYFAIPGILFDGLSPFKSIGESGRLIKAKWGTAMRVNVAAGALLALAIFASFGSIMGGLFVFANANSGVENTIVWPMGSTLLVAFGILLLFVAIFVQGAVLAFLKVALFRFAKDQSSAGFEQNTLASGFKVKKQS